MVMALSDEVKATLLKHIPLGRFGEADEVARFVRYLCTEGDWITGAAVQPQRRAVHVGSLRPAGSGIRERV